MGEGKASPQQCLFLVFDDPGAEHDLFIICSHLDLVHYGLPLLRYPQCDACALGNRI